MTGPGTDERGTDLFGACRRAFAERPARPDLDWADVAPPLFEPDRGPFGKYEPGQELGRGGMGVVLGGVDRRLGRPVAIKIQGGRTGDADGRRRFVAEARITARLEHPNIVPVHDLGQSADGAPFFAMKQVAGRSLAALLAAVRAGEEDYPIGRRLSDFLKVADAISFAHSRGVLHRDLKPDNVMIGEFGEVLVMDWGVARSAGSRSGAGTGEAIDVGSPRTVDGARIGTLAYMSPEQIDGRVDAIDERSDVFALGATLHEVLTLGAAFAGRTADEVIERIRTGRRTVADLPHELAAVVDRALASRPDDRYPSVADLAADVRAFLDGRALAAVRYTLLDHAVRWVRRHRAVAAVAGAAIALLAVLAVAAAWRIEGERDEALAARDEARALLAERIEREMADRDLAAAGLLLERARGASYRSDVVPAVLRALLADSRARAEAALARQPDHAGALTLLARLDVEDGDFRSAERRLRRALELDPGRSSTRLELASVLLSRAFLATLGYSPDEDRTTGLAFPERMAVEAEIELALADAEGLEAGVDRAVAGALLAFVGGDYAGARFLAGDGLARHEGQPGTESFHWLIGLTSREAAARRAALDEALALRPHAPLIRLSRAIALFGRTSFDEAARELDRILETHPRLVEALCLRGLLRARSADDLDAALADIDLAIALDPDMALSHYMRGRAFQTFGRLEEAIASYDRAIELESRFEAWPLYWRGRALRALGRREASNADFRRALELAPSDFQGRRHIERFLKED